MTIEELLDCSASQLEKMTDAELTEHFKKYFPITRPDQCVKPSGTTSKAPAVNPALSKALALLKEKGIELPSFSDKLTTTRKK